MRKFNLDAEAFKNMPDGSEYISALTDANATAYATYYRRKIRTERFAGIDSDSQTKIVKFIKIIFL